MSVAVVLTVTTADKTPIPTATVSLGPQSSLKTNPNGSVTFNLYGSSFTVSVHSANIPFRADAFQINDNDLKNIPGKNHYDQSRVIRNPQATFIDPQEQIYYFVPSKNLSKDLWPRGGEVTGSWQSNFWSSTSQNLTNDKDTHATGWASFNATATQLDAQSQGNLMCIEWTQPDVAANQRQQYNRYLVFLWRPRSSLEPGSTPRDVIVFFTPQTRNPPNGPFLPDRPPNTSAYPYALNQVDPNRPSLLEQRYVALCGRYLYAGHFMAHQMLAAKKDALIVFPIQPSGQWEALASSQGVCRLLYESILFEHRHRLQAEHPGSSATPPQFAIRQPPPSMGTVVLAAFSYGINNISTVISNAGASRRKWEDEARDPYSASTAKFLKSWKEVWDLDGQPEPSNGGFASWKSMLFNWQHDRTHVKKGRTDRAVRMYHTSFTASDVQLNQATYFVGSAMSPPISSKKVKEYHGPSGDVVWLDYLYLSGNSPSPQKWLYRPHTNGDPYPDRPDFWIYDPVWEKKNKQEGFAAHQTGMRIWFAHAAARSSLRALRYGN